MSTYLSPAFHRRSKREIVFLRDVHKNSGFSIFWIDITEPLLRHVQARQLLEIGAYRGDHTRLIEQYCETYDGHLTVVEPTVPASLNEIADRSDRIRLVEATSQEAIPLLDTPADAVLLEGDLNYYTVYNDLVAVGQHSQRLGAEFPLVFLRATGWPYARRDMYYDPELLPAGNVHKYDRSGMSHWSLHLQTGMINHPFANAEHEGGQFNGVLTAAEDFIERTGTPLKLFTLSIHNGLSIIYPEASAADEFIRNNIGSGQTLLRLMETVEIARLNSIIKELQMLQDQQHAAVEIPKWERRINRLAHKIFNREK